MAKAITLIGMSGVGKTHWAWALEKQGWFHYNCDYLIGTKYLRDELGDAVKLDDLSALSNYVGQVGRGKLPLPEFKRRQKRYIEAERAAMYDMREEIAQRGGNVVNDATGSFCEIGDEEMYRRVAEDSLVVYIKAGPEEEQALVDLALADPKPLYFPPSHFDGWLKEYMAERKLGAVEEIEPNDFSRWVFPRLFRSRLPKYQRLADQYGMTVSSAELRKIASVPEFLKVIGA